MTTTTTLKAAKREGSGKGAARKLRQSGRVPAVLYGRDMETMHLSLDAMEAEHLFSTISVENTIVQLKVEGERRGFETLVREIQSNPVRNSLVHVDFFRIQKGVAVDVEVPVHLTGVPVGVKQNGGVLEQIIHEVPVRCLPDKIPESFEVDVSALEIDDALHVSDLTVEEGVEVSIDLDRTLCQVAPPRVVEEEVEEEAAEALAEAPEPEVIGESGSREEDEE